MTDPIKKSIEDCLATIPAPGKDSDLMAAGCVSAIVINEGDVGIVLDMGKAAISSIEGPTGTIEETRQRAEDAVRQLEGVDTVNIVITAAKRPNAPKPAAPKAQPATPPPPKPMEIPGVRHVIAVASGKGGVGKSTTSANLALALREQGLEVGIMDADIFGPSLPTLFGISDRPEIKNGVIQPIMAHGLKIMSIGFLIDVDQPVVWRGPRVMGAVQQLLKDVAWGPLDVLIVDMPPGTGDVQLSMVQNAPLKGAVIVSTPQDLALIDARKGITMFEKVGVPILGLIENMSSFVCPHCGGESHIFGENGAKAIAAKLGYRLLGSVPLHMDIRALSDAGTPIVAEQPQSVFADIYLSIAKQVSDQISA